MHGYAPLTVEKLLGFMGKYGMEKSFMAMEDSVAKSVCRHPEI